MYIYLHWLVSSVIIFDRSGKYGVFRIFCCQKYGLQKWDTAADAAQKVFFALVEETKEESLRCKDGRKKRHRRGWYEIFRKCIECCIKGTTGGQKDMSENKVMNGQIQKQVIY